MKNILLWIFRFFLFLFLTIVTQIGGIVFLISSIISVRIERKFRFKKTVIFLICYCIFTLIIVPLLAPIWGREKVRHTNNLYPTTFATILLNRNYVKPELNNLLANVAENLFQEQIEMRYLDASFPFIDGFPMIPHLSHSDGEKIDISFVYSEPGKSIDSKKKKSISGYGVFEGPRPKEVDQIRSCLQKGYWQYDYPKYFTFGSINSELKFSDPLNSRLIKSILSQKKLGKLFIEPHLKNRLKLHNKKVRFQGCRSVRHDDHIHIQL